MRDARNHFACRGYIFPKWKCKVHFRDKGDRFFFLTVVEIAEEISSPRASDKRTFFMTSQILLAILVDFLECEKFDIVLFYFHSLERNVTFPANYQ